MTDAARYPQSVLTRPGDVERAFTINRAVSYRDVKTSSHPGERELKESCQEWLANRSPSTRARLFHQPRSQVCFGPAGGKSHSTISATNSTMHHDANLHCQVYARLGVDVRFQSAPRHRRCHTRRRQTVHGGADVRSRCFVHDARAPAVTGQYLSSPPFHRAVKCLRVVVTFKRVIV